MLKDGFDFASTLRERSKWWQGDILNTVEKGRHSDKYSQLYEATGQPEGSLRNISSIAGKFGPDRRRAGVSWSHHQAVASLPPEVADALLLEAEEKGWNLQQIRAEAREWREENSGTSGGDGDDGTTPRASQTPDGPVVHRGLQPVDESTVPEDQDIFDCPAKGCEDLVFTVQASHCLDCGAHFEAAQYEQCPHCDEEDQPPAGETQTSSGAISGQVITPADSVSGDVRDLLELSGLRSLDVKVVARDLEYDADALAQAMALNEWLTRLIEALAQPEARNGASTVDKPLASEPPRPVQKPSSGKRTRKPKAAATTATTDEQEGSDDGLEDVDFD
jgi:hypothetical protein